LEDFVVTYLCCDKCGKCYELQQNESPEDFDNTCDCGEKLTVYKNLKDFYKNNHPDKPKKGKRGLKFYSLLLIIPVILIALALTLNWGNAGDSTTLLGSNNLGSVTKVVYSHPGNTGPVIAVVTGMHPREISAKEVLPGVVKSYSQSHNIEIVNYQVNVTNDPTDFSVGRAHGQDLVAQYVIPDIKKSHYSLVIIVHDHEKGYGSNGYYIATPSMDSKSVSLGQSVHNLLPSFNYYTRNTNQQPEGTSIQQVDDPIVATGTPVFVYEIPEWLPDSDVYQNSTKLLAAVYKSL
jgi:hypothetical protein